jgi:hypothetical protein
MLLYIAHFLILMNNLDFDFNGEKLIEKEKKRK